MAVPDSVAVVSFTGSTLNLDGHGFGCARFLLRSERGKTFALEGENAFFYDEVVDGDIEGCA